MPCREIMADKNGGGLRETCCRDPRLQRVVSVYDVGRFLNLIDLRENRDAQLLQLMRDGAQLGAVHHGQMSHRAQSCRKVPGEHLRSTASVQTDVGDQDPQWLVELRQLGHLVGIRGHRPRTGMARFVSQSACDGVFRFTMFEETVSAGRGERRLMH